MKLSEVRGDRALDVVADLIDPIANIAEDKTAATLFARQKAPEGMDARAFLIQRLKSAVPKLIKSHKEDIIAILSAVEGSSPEAYKSSLSLAKLASDCLELLTDEAFIGLFSSAQDGGTPSGSAQESTEAQRA